MDNSPVNKTTVTLVKHFMDRLDRIEKRNAKIPIKVKKLERRFTRVRK